MQAALRSKLISADDAAALVKSGDWIDFTAVSASPISSTRRWRAARTSCATSGSARASRLRRGPCSRPTRPASTSSGSTGTSRAYDRGCNVDGRCNYIPMNFGERPSTTAASSSRPTSSCIKTCPMDEHGYFNFGGAVAYAQGADRAREGRHRRDVRGDALRLRPGGIGARERGDARDRRRAGRAPGAGEPADHRRRPQGRRVDRRRARGRLVPADRHRRHAERGVQRARRTPACATSASTPRCSSTAWST